MLEYRIHAIVHGRRVCWVLLPLPKLEKGEELQHETIPRKAIMHFPS